MRQQKIQRLQTVDQHGWTSPPGSSTSLTGLIAWLLVGFKIGIVVVMLIGFLILPMLIEDFRIRRTSASGLSESAAAVVYITSTSLPASTATATLPATATSIPPTETPVPTAGEPTATSTMAASETPAVAMTLAPRIPTATSTPLPPTVAPVPVSFELSGITFHQQGWNNCGPANLAMGLSYFGWSGDQNDTAAVLKPDREDKNVTPEQMVAYVNDYTNLRATWRMAGTVDIIKRLISNEFVVIVESGYDPNNGEGWYGHYETVVSYNDATDSITVYDSYLGRASNPSITRNFDEFDANWQAFNRNYIVIYPANREAELVALMGEDWLLSENRRNALVMAQQEASADPENPYAWFNLGTAFVSSGYYEEAVSAYTRSFELDLPYRMMWYQFGPYEALLQTGRLSEVRLLAGETLQTTRYVEETFYYLGRAYEQQGNFQSAAENYDLALELNPNFTLAQAALRRVSS